MTQKNGENPTNKWWKSDQQMVKILYTKKWVQILSVDSRYWFRELGAICSLNFWKFRGEISQKLGHFARRRVTACFFPEPKTNMAATPRQKKIWGFEPAKENPDPSNIWLFEEDPPKKTHPSTEYRLKSPFHWGWVQPGILRALIPRCRRPVANESVLGCRPLRLLKNPHPGDDLMASPKKKLHIFRFFHVFFPSSRFWECITRCITSWIYLEVHPT